MRKTPLLLFLCVVLQWSVEASFRSQMNDCEFARKSFYNLSDNLKVKWREFQGFLRENNIQYYRNDDAFIRMVGPVIKPTNFDVGRPSDDPNDKRIYIEMEIKAPSRQLPMALYVAGILQGSVMLEPCGSDGMLGANYHTFGIRALKGTLQKKDHLYAWTTIGRNPPGHLIGSYRIWDLNVAEYIVIPDTAFNSNNSHLLAKVDEYMRYFKGAYAGDY